MVCDGIVLTHLSSVEVVLILILLEYGLRQEIKRAEKQGDVVLILILLEYGLRHIRNQTKRRVHYSLNPYSIGIWSATFLHKVSIMEKKVLILILLEYGLRQNKTALSARTRLVLILILLEYGLRPITDLTGVRPTGVLILILLEYGLRRCTAII